MSRAQETSLRRKSIESEILYNYGTEKMIEYSNLKDLVEKQGSNNSDLLRSEGAGAESNPVQTHVVENSNALSEAVESSDILAADSDTRKSLCTHRARSKWWKPHTLYTSEAPDEQ